MKPNEAAGLRLPALSRHWPLMTALALSGVEYALAGSQEPIPEVSSVPLKPTVSEALYQPFAFGCLPGVADACGAVASYLSGKEAGVPFPALSRQVPLTTAETESGPP